ncbi:hypothetical protein [Oceanobacter mangrovi]|uniref:hypothetical protein n=1 Tax=Oceanobacter mangrovi TaxID=2862510 RepID=UPI001C8E93BB|nr:hypothetical protein [Oceanobacter mangrovi]
MSATLLKFPRPGVIRLLSTQRTSTSVTTANSRGCVLELLERQLQREDSPQRLQQLLESYLDLGLLQAQHQSSRQQAQLLQRLCLVLADVSSQHPQQSPCYQLCQDCLYQPMFALQHCGVSQQTTACLRQLRQLQLHQLQPQQLQPQQPA